MSVPPLNAGADHETVAEPLVATALTDVATPGTVTGVAVAASDDALVPTPLIATTVKAYDVPFVRPVIVQL